MPPTRARWISLVVVVCGPLACSGEPGLPSADAAAPDGATLSTDATTVIEAAAPADAGPDGSAAVPPAADYEWSRLPGNPGAPRVADHVAMAFDGRLWVMGGHRLNSGLPGNDVWSTQDGVTWTQVTAAAAWAPRSLFAGDVFRGAMWITDGLRIGDVWRSTDGATWSEVKGNRFPVRYGHQLVAHRERLYLIAGYGAAGRPIGDVWSSSDGMDWRQETALAEFGNRDDATALAFADRLWLIGGYGDDGPTDDVWSSEDGAHWKLVTAHAGFPRRTGHMSAVLDGRLWVLGGEGYPSDVKLTDVWSSTDGMAWTQSPAAPWQPHDYSMTGTTFQESLWVVGRDGVWKMSRRR